MITFTKDDKERTFEANAAFCQAFVDFNGDRTAIEKHLKITRHTLRAKIAQLTKRYEKYAAVLNKYKKNINNKKSPGKDKTSREVKAAAAYAEATSKQVEHVVENQAEAVQS